MVNKKSSPKKKKRRYTFQLTLSSLLLLSIFLVFILAWIFSLGIMVGRGLLPSAIEGFSSIKEKVANDEEGERPSLTVSYADGSWGCLIREIEAIHTSAGKSPRRPGARPLDDSANGRH